MSRRTPPVATFRLHRAGSLEPNARDFERRAKVFASAALGQGATSLLVTRRGGAMSVYASIPGAGAQAAATHLGAAVAARAELCEFPAADLDTESVGWVDVDERSMPTRDNKFDNSPGEVSAALARCMPNNSWMAVLMRAPDRKEVRRWRPWLSHALGQSGGLPVHHSIATEAVVCSVLAGTDDRFSTETFLSQVSSALPGFDLTIRPRTMTSKDLIRGPLSAAVGMVVACVLVWILLGFAGSGPLDWSLLRDRNQAGGLLAEAARRLLPPLLLLGAVGCGVWALARRLGWAKRWAHQVLQVPGTGVLPSPPRRSRAPRAPRETRTVNREDGPQIIPADAGEYPLDAASFLVGPEVVVGVAAPQGGVAYGEQSGTDKAVPPAVLTDQGPLVGTTPAGQVYLSAPDMAFGVAVTGKPGSGKTKLLNALFGWSCCERSAPTGRPGFPGRNNTLMVFDAKGDETPELCRWAHAAGQEPVVVEIGNAATVGIDMFATVGTAAERAGTFVNAMVYAFERGDIQGRSFEVLHAAFTAAIAWTPECFPPEGIVGFPANPSIVELAHGFCGGFGDSVAVALWGGVGSEALRLADAEKNRPVQAMSAPVRDLVEARKELAVFFDGVTPSARRDRTEAARNKTKSLLEVSAWWSPERTRRSFDDLVGSHAAVIINLGATTLADGSKVLVDDRVSKQVSSMLFFMLQNTIQRQCFGWARANRWISIFSDELATQAVHSAEKIEWFRDQGRSYGVRLYLATQRPGQLPAPVQTAFLTLATLVSLPQEEVSAAQSVATQMGHSASDVSAEDITSLRPFTAMVRTYVEGVRQTPFVMAVPNFEADRGDAQTMWGWSPEQFAVLPDTPEVLVPTEPGSPADATVHTAADTGSFVGAPTESEPWWGEPLVDGQGQPVVRDFDTSDDIDTDWDDDDTPTPTRPHPTPTSPDPAGWGDPMHQPTPSRADETHTSAITPRPAGEDGSGGEAVEHPEVTDLDLRWQ